MTRPAGDILILADADELVAALESALLRREANVLVGAPEAASLLLERTECDVVVADVQRLEARGQSALESSASAPVLVALLAGSQIQDADQRWKIRIPRPQPRSTA